MASTNAIAESIKLIEIKKSNLHKTFTDLQSHSQILSSFLLQWNELNDLITTIQNSFKSLLDSIESNQPQSSTKTVTKSPAAAKIAPKPATKPPPAPARPALKSLCAKMDSTGLRKFVYDWPRERQAIRNELPEAIRSAPDPVGLVLGAMAEFYKENTDNDLDSIRRICVILLEALMELNLEISSEAKERAKKLAVEWKGKLKAAENNTLEASGFLQLLATFGLGYEFDVNELAGLFVLILKKHKQATSNFRALGFIDRENDVIQKLVSNGKTVLAVKIIVECGLRDKSPPGPLLKEHVKELRKLAEKIRKDGNHGAQAMNQAHEKEVSGLKAVIKIIKENKLESEYSPEQIIKSIERLEKQKSEQKAKKKRPVPDLLNDPESKRPRNHPLAAPLQGHQHQQGLFNDPYFLNSSAEPYGLAGLGPRAPPYLSSSAGPFGASSGGPYGHSGPSVDFPGNLSPASRSCLYPLDSNLSSSYYDRPTAYGGYGLPPQYPSSRY